MSDELYLQISLIQHYLFCKRQFALMHLEDIWAENVDTIKGHNMHERVHDNQFTEKRGNKILSRGIPINSHELKINGVTDMVEFIKSDDGVEIKGFEGKYIPYLIEYKKGRPKKDNTDIMQLIAQAYCLEEMYNIKIPESAIYYKQINRRQKIQITDQLRKELKDTISDIYKLIDSGKTPKAELRNNCNKCSLYSDCWPRLTNRKKSVRNYLREHLEVDI